MTFAGNMQGDYFVTILLRIYSEAPKYLVVSLAYSQSEIFNTFLHISTYKTLEKEPRIFTQKPDRITFFLAINKIQKAL